MLLTFVPWALAATICAAVAYLGFVRLRPFREVLTPMWLPLSVMFVAGWALLGTDQGRDLGVGLLANGTLQLFLLALALFYWATGSWHSARLGLNRRFGADPTRWPPGYEQRLRWSPRALGACAHLLASLSVALAAWRVAADSEPVIHLLSWRIALPLWPILFMPPTIIVVGTFVLWLCDRRYAAARQRFYRAKRAYETPGKQLRTAAVYSKARTHLYQVVGGLVAVAAALIGLLWALHGSLPEAPSLVPATSFILASAVLFLLIVSRRRAIGELIVRNVPEPVARLLNETFRETDERSAWSSMLLAAFLSLAALIVGIWTWYDPVSVGQTAGSMPIAFYAFGAYIGVIDLLRISCGSDLGSSARFAAVCAFLLLLAAATSATRDFHRVRLCGDARTPCALSTADGGERNAKEERWHDRPTVAEAARAWYRQAAAKSPEGEPVPMLVIATAGGGLRAAYWTATILEQLEHELTPEVFRRHLFAISGVSGGSVGATAYAAARATDSAGTAKPTDYLDEDFLAPAVAATAFIDGPSSLLPDFGQGDRGYALERAWERASTDERLARPFLSFFPSEQELEEAHPDVGWRPALVLNATHQDTGRRVITSHLQVERHVFLDSFDVHDLLQADMPASAAAHNSARFTYVSPAGKLVPRSSGGGPSRNVGFLLDGGYFENFGALTALQLVREARRAIGPDKVRPVILQISSDPSLTARDRARLDREEVPLCNASEEAPFLPYQRGEWQGWHWKQRDGGSWISSFFNELTAPIAGIMASRVARGTLASQELAYTICDGRRAPATPNPPGPLRNVALSPPETDNPPEVNRPPEFAHLAMCDDEAGAVVPPLGWVLSSLIRDRFPSILEQCGNPEELNRLTAVFEVDNAL
jgi:hypothetical protein